MSASIGVPNGQNLDFGVTPTRQYPPGTIRPVDQKNPPLVVSATGFGTGGGAFITNQGADADAAQGLIACRVGLGPLTSGSVVIAFPQTPPAAAGGFVITAGWAATLSVSGTNPYTIAWTQQAADPLVTGTVRHIAYSWRNAV